MAHYKRVVILAKQNESYLEYIENLCLDKNYTLTKMYQINKLINESSSWDYDLLIIDYKNFPLGDDLLTLFTHKSYYIPYIVVLSDIEQVFENKSIVVLQFEQLNKLDELFSKFFNKKNNIDYFPSNTILHSRITNEMIKLGIPSKYKGFYYLVDIVYKSIVNNLPCKSLKRIYYPFIASLYDVTPESVERNIRNLFAITRKREMFCEKLYINEYAIQPTTRNLVCAVIEHIKKFV